MNLSHAIIILQDSNMELHRLTGATYATLRQRILSALTGRNISIPNSSLRVLCRAFYAHARIEQDTSRNMALSFSAFLAKHGGVSEI